MANILIVGDGAIGLLFGHFWGEQHTVSVLTRKNPQQPRSFCRDQHAAQTIKASYISHEQLSTLASKPTTLTPDLVIFAVKAFQVQSAFTQVQPHLSPSSSIVISHNGMGNIEEIKRQLHPQQALYFLTTNIAALKKSP